LKVTIDEINDRVDEDDNILRNMPPKEEVKLFGSEGGGE
jgi:hypothetical protein